MRGAWDNALYLAHQIDRHAVEFEFILPALREVIVNCGDDPVSHLLTWCNGFDIKSHQSEGGRNRPYYGVHEAKRNWHLMNFIERIYLFHTKSKVSSSFKRILTMKKFCDLFGHAQIDRKIRFNGKVQNSDLQVLQKLGILETVEVRISFLRGICSKLEKAASSRGLQEVEDWL